MFLTVDSLLNEECPKPQRADIRDMKLDILQTTQEEINNACFTVVRLTADDFSIGNAPKKIPRLLFVNKDAYNDNLVKDLAPFVIVAMHERGVRGSGCISGVTHNCMEKLRMIMLDNYLVLTLYPCNSRKFMTYGADYVQYGSFSGVKGKLRFGCFYPVHMFLFGKPYVCRYSIGTVSSLMDKDFLVNVWRNCTAAMDSYDMEAALC